MARSRPTRRSLYRRIGLALPLVAMTVWFAAGWHYVPADRWAVRAFMIGERASTPLSEGWHWTPPLVCSRHSYPRGVTAHDFVIGAGENRLVAESGAALAVSGTLSYRVDESGLDLLVSRMSGDPAAAWLDAALRDSVRQVLSEGHAPGTPDSTQGPFRAEVRERLAAAGLSLVDLRLDAIGGPQQVAGRTDGGVLPGSRVLVVGWDGADWNILEPLLGRGELPNLAGLLRNGSRARLRTVTPVLSPVVWTSVATGTLPAKHGIVDFLAVDRLTGERIPVTSSLRQVPALWTLLSRRRLSVGVVAWWATWPAEAVSGYLVSDRIAFQLFGMGDDLGDGPEGKTWPPELYDEIRPLVRRPESITDDEVRALVPLPDDLSTLTKEDRDLVDEFRTVLAATETYDAMARRLATRGEPVLRCVYYEASDTAAHLFMRYHAPRLPGVSEESFALWSGVIDAVYRDLDRRLGALLTTIDDDTTVILLSDHGFRTGDNRPVGDSRIGGGRAADWHRKYGVLVISGTRARPGAEIDEASVIDVAPTVLALLGLPVPENMDGQVLETGLDPSFLSAHPVQHEAPADMTRTTTQPIRSGRDDAIVERLRSLGYIGTDPVDAATPGVDRLAQDEVTAFNNRATILLADGRPAEAEIELRKGLEQAPAAVPLRLNLARALHAQSREEEALEVAGAVRADEPDSPDVLNLVANLHMDTGQLEAAERDLQRALAIDPNFAAGLITLGLLRERQGDLEAAVVRFRRAAAIDPDAPEPYNNIGNIRRSQARNAWSRGAHQAAAGLFEQAVEAYGQGLAADPDFIGSYNNLALVYQETGRNDEAMDLYRQALERRPGHAVVHNNLGSLYFAAGQLDGAQSEFAAAIAADPDYAEAHNNLGAVLGRLGDFDDELAAYRRAVEISPDYADGWHNLGLALRRDNDARGAEDALRRALTLQPDYLSAYVALGSVYLEQGNPQAAAAEFAACLAINPGLIDVRNRLAEAWVAAGETEKGIAEYRRSLADWPEQPEVQRRLDELGS